jgi:hypothetical protein
MRRSEPAREERPEPPVGLRLVLGDMVLTVGQIEDYAYDIAGLLRIPDPAAMSSTRALGKVEAIAPGGLPPWTSSRLTPTHVVAWAREARAMVEERNTLFHATHAYSIGSEHEWIVVRHSLRDGHRVTSDVEELEKLLTRMQRARDLGLRIEQMLAMPAPGGGTVPPPYVRRRMAPLAGHYLWGPLPESWWEWIEGAPQWPMLSKGASEG